MPDRFWPGDDVRISGTFRVDGLLTDPTTISLTVKDGNDVINTYTFAGGTITRVSAGFYAKTIANVVAGMYYYRWEGTGVCEAVDESRFLVRQTTVD